MMWTIFWKELRTTFSSLTAYMVLGSFLTLSGLVTWVMPGVCIWDTGMADLSPFFAVAPYLMMWLIPAMTMNTLAGERQAGTLELLLTSPISWHQILWGKYGAVIFQLTLLWGLTGSYYITIHQLSMPVGNVDGAAVVGSYLGLWLLSATFAAVGLWTSSWAAHPIHALLGGVMVCFSFYHLPDVWGMTHAWDPSSLWVVRWGGRYHYDAISRGVVDLHDVTYFMGWIAWFMVLAHSGWAGLRKHLRYYAGVLGLVTGLHIGIGSMGHYVRFDLTQDHRYTLNKATREWLQRIQDPVVVDVYLDGLLPLALQHLKESMEVFLNEARRSAPQKLSYRWVRLDTLSSQKRQEHFKRLQKYHLNPFHVWTNQKGKRTEQLIFPYAVVSCGAYECPLRLLHGDDMENPIGVAQQSIDRLEYSFLHACRGALSEDHQRIALLQGHGGPPLKELQGLIEGVRAYRRLDAVCLSDTPELNLYDAVLIINPQRPFSAMELYLLDQYVMHGGRLLVFANKAQMDLQNLQGGKAVTRCTDTGLDELLFRYGIRINNDLIQDLCSGVYPVVVGMLDHKPQVKLLPWPYFPLITHFADHPIVRRLDAVYPRFTNSMTAIATPHVIQTPLMFTSGHTRCIPGPVHIDLERLRHAPNPTTYTQKHLPIAYLMEGRFGSLFKNRLLPAEANPASFKAESSPTQMLVVSSQGIVTHSTPSHTQERLPWGYDPLMRRTFAHSDLVNHTLDYMLDRHVFIAMHQKQIQLRLMDPQKAIQDQTYWQWVNLLLPLVLLFMVGGGWSYLYMRAYAYRKD